MTLSQVGELASSKSAMKTLAPELRALIIIFRSTGPGDLDPSVRQRLGRLGDCPEPVADTDRLGEEVGALPASKRAWRSARAASRARRRRVEGPVQAGDELDRLRREDPLGVGMRACSRWFRVLGTTHMSAERIDYLSGYKHLERLVLWPN